MKLSEPKQRYGNKRAKEIHKMRKRCMKFKGLGEKRRIGTTSY